MPKPVGKNPANCVKINRRFPCRKLEIYFLALVGIFAVTGRSLCGVPKMNGVDIELGRVKVVVIV